MHITHEMNMHNCQLCRKEWLGRCFGKKYGKDVSVDNEPCKRLKEKGVIIEHCLHGLIYLMKVEINLRYFMNVMLMP